MALPKQLPIKESIAELRSLQRRQGYLISRRIAVLIEIKKHEKTGVSKRALSALTGVNHNSIVKWRKLYETQGIAGILKHGRIGFKKPILKPSEHKKIAQKLQDPTNGISGYAELLAWVKKELHKDMKYITLLKYVQRHFGAKVKVARKSHVKKDKEAVEAFKKTLVISASS